ncbi:MAG TPA: DUF456 domain-containing protein [bacterium]|nr:DUF456 domain-containing protein [bacterium]
MTHQILSVTYDVLLCLLVVGGIVMVLFTLPGTWVIVAAALLYSLVRDFQVSSDLIVIAWLVVLALIGEAIEFATGTLGPKKVEVPTGAIVCSIIGGIVGAIIGVPVFLIGAVLGLLLGTFLGALIYTLIKDGRVKVAFKHAFAVLTSRVISIFAKTAIAVGMAIYLLIKVF